ncbi:nidogen-like [Tigriopus californicus]|uniref:nidogen-like n=1 Tax=Tigriopus californicus TaxID=6832 RepID=UPI0027DA5D9A|nr:nidogen-like [Tigriopus californicus]
MVLKSLLVGLFLFGFTRGISNSDIFPYGAPAGDNQLNSNAEDSSSQEIDLGVEAKFFNRRYRTVFVNENGLLSFLAEIPSYFNVQFPLDYPLIAGLYSDVDCRESGSVWFRITSDSTLLGRAQSRIESQFQASFQPEELIIATWDRVGYYERASWKKNTFQIVVASNEMDTYVLMLYPEGGIQWIKAEGKNKNMPDARGQAGIISGEGRHHLLRASGTDQIRHLDKWSNANEAGVWLYKVGPLDESEPIKEPPMTTNNQFNPETAQSCSMGSTMCHSQGSCIDHTRGFCCQCGENWFGNGRTCLPKGLAQRVNGRMSGNVNSITFQDEDLHCYVVTDDGRTYTAISRVPSRIGPEMRGLTIMGGPIGWLFAQPMQGAQNGFDITGGIFNYTGTVTFPDTRHSVTINLRFLGLDAFDYLKVEGSVDGTLPPINPPTAEIQLEDYSEEFSKIQPGVIIANAQRSFKIGDTGNLVNFEVQHRIDYDGCKAEPNDPQTRTSRFKSSRNYIVYDGAEEVVRYAMTSQMVPLGSDEDPCRGISCGVDSYCTSSEGEARCVCNAGFQEYDYGDGNKGCRDVDECAAGSNNCSPDADCYNQQGSFQCACRAGYIGNGVNCVEDVSCNQLDCNDNSECVVDRYGQPSCQCISGFTGDGEVCKIVPSEIRISGFAQPEELLFDNANPDENDPRNIEVNHFYQVSNLGPHTVGGLEVEVKWPLKDSQDQPITVLSVKPQVKYSGPMGDYLDDCHIDPSYLSASRVKRQGEEDFLEIQDLPKSDTMYSEDVDYDMETEMEYMEQNGIKFPEYGFPLESEPLPEYDYSNFESYNTVRPPPVTPESQQVTETPSDVGAGVSETTQSKDSGVENEAKDPGNGEDETPMSKLKGPGMISFTCKMNLAQQESATITVRSVLAVNNLVEQYKGIAQFQIPSEAVVIKDETIRIVGSKIASTETNVLPRDPTISLAPGQGFECGTIQCNRYADCFYLFNGRDEPECQCLPGFKGNGQECEQLEPTEVDCRQAQNCHADAMCAFDGQHGTFQCKCKSGFEGDGLSCYLKEETCLTLDNCSPYADCLGDYSGRFSCECQQGYRGDGFSCYPEPSATSQNNPSGVSKERNSSLNPSQNQLDRGQAQSPQEVVPNCYRGSCACPPGYTYDGDRCLEKSTENVPKEVGFEENSPDLCSSNEECDANASCQYNEGETRYQCVCNQFYFGNGFSCQIGPDADCNIKKDCGYQAQCVRNQDGDYSCECDKGFKGDGYFCKKDVIGCNIINNCGKYADCLFDFDEGGYRCKCDQNRGFEGDGYVCKSTQSCQENPSICDVNAMCVPDERSGGVKCQCREFYEGDGFICQAIPAQDQGYMIASQGLALMKIPFSAKLTNPGVPIMFKTSQTATGLQVDCQEEKIYWTDTTGRAIFSSNYDGSQTEPFLNAAMGFPEGIALDVDARNVYWVDSGKRTIEVARMDSKARAVIVEDNMWNPRGITLFAPMGRMFWSDWDVRKPRIESANLDGSDRIVLVDNMIGMPNSLAVDSVRYQLCWTDGGSPLRFDRAEVPPKIECMDMYGSSNRRPVIVLKDSFPYGLALTNDYVYWTDWKNPQIHGAHRESGERIPSLPHVLGMMGRPFGLVVVPQTCPTGNNNPCSENSCQYNQICLPDGRGGSKCQCDDNDPNCTSS